MLNFLLGLLLVVISGFTVYYSRQLEDWFGQVRWAEENLGGTAQMYVLIGLGLMILGFMVIFGFVKIA